MKKSNKEILGEFSESDDFLRYRNVFFQFEIDINKEWNLVKGEEMILLLMQKIGAITSDDEQKEAIIEASKEQSLNLFRCSKYPIGTNVEENPSLTCAAYNLRMFPEIKTEKDYLLNLKETISTFKSNIDYVVQDKFDAQIFGGARFYILNADGYIHGNENKPVKVKNYCSIIKGYALTFGLTYREGEGYEELKKIIYSFKMNKSMN